MDPADPETGATATRLSVMEMQRPAHAPFQVDLRQHSPQMRAVVLQAVRIGRLLAGVVVPSGAKAFGALEARSVVDATSGLVCCGAQNKDRNSERRPEKRTQAAQTTSFSHRNCWRRIACMPGRRSGVRGERHLSWPRTVPVGAAGAPCRALCDERETGRPCTGAGKGFGRRSTSMNRRG